VRLGAVAVVAGALGAAPVAQALPTTIVSAANAVGGGSVTCPFPGRVSSGGFSGDIGGLVTSSLSPSSSLRAWSTIVDGSRYPSTGTTHAVCVSGDLTLTVTSAPLTFSSIPKFVSAATATCANPLSRVVGGGFQTGSASNTNPVTASYPSGPRSWTVRAEARSLRDIPQGFAFAYCSMLALGTTIVQSPSAAVPCNFGLQTYGGGWSGGEARSSFPNGGRGWFAEVPVALEGETARSYAICGS
jgi:hypothetical protein